MRTASLMLALTLLGTSCYRATGQLKMSTAVVPELAETKQVIVPVPERDSITLDHQFSGSQMEVQATRFVACEDREMRTYERKEVETRKLPWHHWLVFGSGLVLGGTGAYAWSDGAQKVDVGDGFDIGTPAQEREYDEGKRNTAIGVGLVAAGGALLISEIIDLAIAKDREKRLPNITETTVLSQRTCKKQPEASLKLWAVGADGSRVDLQTDVNGRISTDLIEGSVSDMPYSQPFCTLRCRVCSEVSVNLPPEISARLVKKHRKIEEIDLWLERHGSSAAAGSVRAVRVELLQAEVKGFLERGEAALQGREFAELAESVVEANQWLGVHASSADTAGAFRQRVRTLGASGKQALAEEVKNLTKKREFDSALGLLSHCDVLSESNDDCSELRKGVVSAQHKWQEKEEKRKRAEERKLNAWGKKNRGRAKTAARSAVTDRLKAPMSANWVSTEVLDYKGNRYVVHVVVDAMNSFGAYLRNSYCVVLTLDMKKRKIYFINEALGVQECNREPTEKEIEMMKALNHW